MSILSRQEIRTQRTPSAPAVPPVVKRRPRMPSVPSPTAVQLPLFPDVVDLVRIRPAMNERRYYRIEVLTDLFGTIGILRCWGRIGISSRSRFDPAPDLGTALDRLADLARAKRERGYQDRLARRAMHIVPRELDFPG